MKQVSTSRDRAARPAASTAQPHAILGPHPDGDGVTFRIVQAAGAHGDRRDLGDGARVPLEHEHDGRLGRRGPTVADGR